PDGTGDHPRIGLVRVGAADVQERDPDAVGEHSFQLIGTQRSFHCPLPIRSFSNDGDHARSGTASTHSAPRKISTFPGPELSKTLWRIAPPSRVLFLARRRKPASGWRHHRHGIAPSPRSETVRQLARYRERSTRSKRKEGGP